MHSLQASIFKKEGVSSARVGFQVGRHRLLIVVQPKPCDGLLQAQKLIAREVSDQPAAMVARQETDTGLAHDPGCPARTHRYVRIDGRIVPSNDRCQLPADG
jgi:hypothetical protein